MSGNPLSRSRSVERLSARRRKSRRRALSAFFILLLFLLAAFMWGVRQPSVRISRVNVSGAAPAAGAALQRVAQSALSGAYLGIIPRDSIFFFPAQTIRARILAATPELASLSIRRESAHGIVLVAHERIALARWCGATPPAALAAASSTPPSGCFVFDASGFVYADDAASAPVLPFSLYAPLAGAATSAPATLSDANALPAVFDFARQAGTHGSPVVTIVLRTDAGEADDYLASGTRLTYVLGREVDALTALASARESLNLADGFLSYVDLRFPGKVYVKKAGSAP